jgi:integrase/recombinase XerD
MYALGGIEMAKKVIKKNTSTSLPILMAFEEFLREKEIMGKSTATLTNYATTYGIFIDNMGYDDLETEVNAITLDSIYDWISIMREMDKKVSTINHYLRDMRTFLYWCMSVDKQYIANTYKIQLLTGQEETLKIFTDEQIEALLEKPRKKDSFTTWRTWAIVNWVLATGNRAATVCEVKIEDINFDAKQILLRHTKNKQIQTIPLSPALEKVIKEYMRLFRSNAKPKHYLFPSIEGIQLTTNANRQAFERYCSDRDVDRHNIHGLRHSFARNWIRNGGSSFQLQQILGHATLDMTRKYVKLFGVDLQQDFEEFNPLDNITGSKSRKQIIKRVEEPTTTKAKRKTQKQVSAARSYVDRFRKGR